MASAPSRRWVRNGAPQAPRRAREERPPPAPAVAGSAGPVAIVGGGLAGLACGWALKRKGLPAVVLDTGKRGPGGRASSRQLRLGGAQQAVDHAVQAFTVQRPEVAVLVDEAKAAGAVRRWEGAVGTWKKGEGFSPHDAKDKGPLWIGGAEQGMGSLANWLAGEQSVVKDVWVSRLAASSDGENWRLLDQRGREVGGFGSYGYVVMAHNGKCADRLIKTSPIATAAHAPLRCKFTDKASAVSDRLELSSLWVCVVAVPQGAADFEGAFVEGCPVLSWAGNNSAKYPRGGGGVEAWTLISTAQYGGANKCPQEAIPEDVRQKVTREMRKAFAALLQRPLEPEKLEVLHLQLWGAALPLNVCGQDFVHDPEACVGICGDWLTAPSVEGALFSGIALAEAIEAHLAGGRPATGVQQFRGLSGCHAIGSFEAAAEKGQEGSEAKRGKWRRERPQEGGEVWHFAYGTSADLSLAKTLELRGARPEQLAAKLKGWRLLFNHKGGVANIEKLPEARPGPEAVHGVLRCVAEAEFRAVAQKEELLTTEEVVVEAYDGRSLRARVLVSKPEWRLRGEPPAPARFLKLIREQCAAVAVDAEYQAWLASLPTCSGERGPEYWDVPGADRQRKPTEKAKAAAADEPSSLLRLAALADFAVKAPLVEIGANMGKCKDQDLAQQLARAKAAGVDPIILTGCGVRSSHDAQRVAKAWSGAEASSEHVRRHLGERGSAELAAAGIARLPLLYFTAGVHPHEAKHFDKETMASLRALAQDAGCVSIGECGLDYDRMFSRREVQLSACQKQVELAVELKMPLFLHERDQDKGPLLGSCKDLLAILEAAGAEPSRCCVHCFTGSKEDLRTYVSRGYMIGLTGFVAMKQRGAHIQKFLKEGEIPLEQLMLETDCPFMMPDKAWLPAAIGIQGRRNEPCAVPAVCRAVAECLGRTPEAVAEVTTANAARFFGL